MGASAPRRTPPIPGQGCWLGRTNPLGRVAWASNACSSGGMQRGSRQRGAYVSQLLEGRKNV